MSENLLCFYKFSLHLYILYDILCINSLHCIQTTVQTEQAGGLPCEPGRGDDSGYDPRDSSCYYWKRGFFYVFTFPYASAIELYKT